MTRTRTITSKLAFISMIAMAGSFVGCATQPVPESTVSPDGVGKLGMNLALPSGQTLTTVGYSISGNGITPITGSINVTQVGATISTQVGGIPAGTGYSVTLTAVTVQTNPQATCLGTANFDVIAGQTTQVSVSMQCRESPTKGNARINASVNQCPEITAFAVDPLATTIGGPVAVSVSATDPNSSQSGFVPLTYSWANAPADGSFASATSATTTFTCNLSGTTTITVSVDDHAGCTDSASAQVVCNSNAICGNGQTEPGEACDLGGTISTSAPNGNNTNTSACPACRNAACGDGFIQAGVEACDDGNQVNGDGCENNCTRTPGCGNGIIDGTEECDGTLGHNGQTLPAGQSCSATCTLIACGNNRVDGTEVCDGTVGANGALGLGQVCAANCLSFTDNCRACENTNCSNYLGLNINLIAACYQNADTTFVQKCVDAIGCARVNNCAYTSRGAEQCFCGDATTSQCNQGTGVNGLCKAQFIAAANVPAGTTGEAAVDSYVTVKFSDRSTPVGNAVFMLACDTASCNAHDAQGHATQCVP